MQKMQARLNVNGNHRSYVRTQEQIERETKNVVRPVRVTKGKPRKVHTVYETSHILANYAKLAKRRAKKQAQEQAQA